MARKRLVAKVTSIKAAPVTTRKVLSYPEIIARVDAEIVLSRKALAGIERQLRALEVMRAEADAFGASALVSARSIRTRSGDIYDQVMGARSDLLENIEVLQDYSKSLSS